MTTKIENTHVESNDFEVKKTLDNYLKSYAPPRGTSNLYAIITQVPPEKNQIYKNKNGSFTLFNQQLTIDESVENPRTNYTP